MRRASNIWVQQIGLIYVLIFLLRSFFAKVVVYYDEKAASPFLQRFLIILDQIGFGGIFQKALLTFNRSDGGACLAYGIREEADRCLEDICHKYGLTGNDRLKNMAKCYLYESIGAKITFIHMVRERIGARGMSQEADHEIYLRRHFLNAFIRDLYRQQGVVIKESGIDHDRIDMILRLFAYFPVILYGKVFHRGVFTNIQEVKPAVWVEFDNDGTIDFCFWQDGVDRNKTEIVYFLYRADTPANPEIIKIIEDRGYKWVDAHFLPVLRMSGIGFGQLGGIIRDLCKDAVRYPLSIVYLFFIDRLNGIIYGAVFKRFQVRVLIQHHDTSWKQEMWARALEASGGALLGFHWSNYPTVLTPSHLFPHHAFFLWGEAFYSIVQEGGHTCQYLLPSGLWIVADGNDPGIEPFPGDVDFTIALFDSSAAYNMHQTEEALSRFYLLILDILEKRTSWGLIIKSKNWNVDGLESLPAGDLIVQKIKHLVESNRARVLPPSSSPVKAAAGADLSVCYGLNSAGIVVALHGHKSIHWDCSGWCRHPFYQDKDQKFLFRDLGELEEAIVKASKGDTAVGDFSRWRRSYNYFDDFNAAGRVGQFIQDIVELSNLHQDTETSLRCAVKKYISENCVDEHLFGSPVAETAIKH